MKAMNSLLIEADQIVRRRNGKPPIRDRKLWINRKRATTQWLKLVADALSKGQRLPDAFPQSLQVNDWLMPGLMFGFIRKRERSAA